MRAARARGPRGPRPGGRLLAAACAALMALLGGCSSDEPGSRASRPTGAPAPAPPVAAAPQGTTDSGSRLVDFTAPLGAVTVETPPLRVRRR